MCASHHSTEKHLQVTIALLFCEKLMKNQLVTRLTDRLLHFPFGQYASISIQLTTLQRNHQQIVKLSCHRRDYDPYFFFSSTVIIVNHGVGINIPLSEKTRHNKEKNPSDLGFTKRSFQRKTRRPATRPRHTPSVCVTVRLFPRAAWPLCLFVSLGRWK